MTDLTDFGVTTEIEKPLIERHRIIQQPTNGKIAGFVGAMKRRGVLAYTTLRSGNHYYRKGGGYAISDSILNEADRENVSRVIIHEGTEDSDDVYEFTLEQYRGPHAKTVPPEDLENPDDPQSFIELDEAVHKWKSHAADLFVYGFRDACERIDWEGYDPSLKGGSDG